MGTLDPCRLDPLASINRVRLDGGEARALLSATGLLALARAHGLAPVGPVRSFLDADPGGPAVAAEFGARLGRLLGLLRSGRRPARPEWDDSWWDRWAAVRTVWLGGGLAGGAFGRQVAAGAAPGAGCRVEVAPGAADLPLLGAARLTGTLPTPAAAAPDPPADAEAGPTADAEAGPTADAGAGPAGQAAAGPAGQAGAGPAGQAGAGPAGDPRVGPAGGAGAGGGGSRVVLDFGHTWVKRAVVSGGRLTRLAPVPAPREDAAGPEVAGAVAATLAATWAEAGRPPGPVVAAMAAYVIDGQPVRTPLGTYARLADVTPDVPAWLAARAGVPVVLVHDGTAAAHAVPPDPRSAVVLLGTSLGVGFPHACPR